MEEYTLQEIIDTLNERPDIRIFFEAYFSLSEKQRKKFLPIVLDVLNGKEPSQIQI